MRFHAAIVALIAGLAGVAGASAADRALVIGNNHYADPGAPALRGPIPDARHMASLLVDELGFAPENVKVIEDAGRADILDGFQSWLIDGTRPGDRVVFYYSGHGTTLKVPNGSGGTRLTSAILPSDAATADKFIRGTEIAKLLDRLRGRKVTIIADSCHSGSISRDPDAAKRPPPPDVRTITPYGVYEVPPGEVTDDMIREGKTELRFLDINARGGTPRDNIAVWSAATISQMSYDRRDGDGGVFTSAFIEGIRDRKGDLSGSGKVTASGLLGYVRKVAGEYCATSPTCTPIGFTPEVLAPGDYLASPLVPYQVATAPVATPDPDAPAPVDPTDPPPPSVEPSGPELVNLAEGVLTHQNDFQLSATILPDVHVHLGDAVRFRIQSAESGQLVVLDTGGDGKIRRIFPNEYSEAQHRTGAIRGGAPLTIPDESYPFDFTADEAGPGTLIVLVAEPGVDIGPLLSGPAFEPGKDVGKALLVVAANLAEPAIHPEPNVPNGAHRWAFVSVPYSIQE